MAKAYLAAGRWIVDCAEPGCANAELAPGRTPGFTCSNCGNRDRVVWPTIADGIDTIMSLRPVPETRNWAPRGHWWEALGYPTGQTLEDLRRENDENGVVT